MSIEDIRQMPVLAVAMADHPEGSYRREASAEALVEISRLHEITGNAEKFAIRENSPDPGKRYEQVFGERVYGVSEGQKLEVQYYTGRMDAKPQTVKIHEEDGKERKLNVVARIWVTDTKKDPPAALCYDLTDEGTWVLRVSDQVRKGNPDDPNEKGYNVWKVGSARTVDKEDVELNIFDRLKTSQNPKNKKQ